MEEEYLVHEDRVWLCSDEFAASPIIIKIYWM